MVEKEGPQMTSQYGAYALLAGLRRLYALMSMQRPRAHMHARTHRPISNTYCFSTATMILEGASVLRYST
jgi:hypothetical protein